MIRPALLLRLQQDAGVAAVAADYLGKPAVDWVTRPRGDTLPGIVLQMIDPGRDYDLDGPDGLSRPRVQADCWGKTFKQAVLLADAVVAALEGPATAGGVDFERSEQIGGRDMPVEDIAGGDKAFRVMTEFYLWWKPTS